jgi:hypothetical protein
MILSKGMSFQNIVNVPRMDLLRQGNIYLSVIGGNLIALSMIAGYLSLVKKKMVFFYVIIGINLVASMAFGARHYLLHFMGPLLFYMVVDNSKANSIRKKWTGKLVVFFLLGILLVGMIGIFQVFRNQNNRTLPELVRITKHPRTYSLMLQNPNAELNFRVWAFSAVDLFPRKHDWLYGNTYLSMLLFWLPTKLSGGLKMDTMYIFSDVIVGTKTSYSLGVSSHPTFTGDLYINFGFLFWIPAILWGIILGINHMKIFKPSAFLYRILIGSTSVYFLLLVFRGSLYQSFMKVIICCFYLSVFIGLYSLFRAASKKMEVKRE